MSEVSRRGLLGLGALAMAGVALPRAAGEPGGASPGQRKRVVRLAHVTDTHTQPELRGVEGTIACLEHLRAKRYAGATDINAPRGTPPLDDGPVDLLVHSGDIVFSINEHGRERSRMLLETTAKVFREHWTGASVWCLGNHDIWGLSKGRSGATGEEADFGKRWAMDVLGVKGEKPGAPYFSMDVGLGSGAWHVVVLDSVRPRGEGYFGGLDDEQFEWLKGDLALNKMRPTLIVSHIPILSAAVLDRAREEDGDVPVPAGRVFVDFERMKKLFLEMPQVKACVAGHLHLRDRVTSNGVTYLCNGAASGAWWKGAHKECREGYAIVDLYDDGSFENAYVEYGWKA